MLEAKPLPKLPRSWTRIRHETAFFLRSLGLGIIVSTYHGLFRKDFSEPRKVAIRKSRVTATLRMFIHIIPISIALLEIILNVKGHYIGADFTKQSFVQLVAKAHELTVQASLAAIVLSYIRMRLRSAEAYPLAPSLGAFNSLRSAIYGPLSYGRLF